MALALSFPCSLCGVRAPGPGIPGLLPPVKGPFPNRLPFQSSNASPIVEKTLRCLNICKKSRWDQPRAVTTHDVSHSLPETDQLMVGYAMKSSRLFIFKCKRDDQPTVRCQGLEGAERANKPHGAAGRQSPEILPQSENPL